MRFNFRSVGLGTKLVFFLVSTLVVTMVVHGYFSVRQEKENILREMKVGMLGLSRAIQAALGYMYGEERDLGATQRFIDGVARSGNIHGVVVYDVSGRSVAVSASLKPTDDFPGLDPQPVLDIDPAPVLRSGREVDGYTESPAHPVYYRIEPILDSDRKIVGAFVLARRGWGFATSIQARRNRIILTTSALVLVLCILIPVLVRRNVSRPIRELIARIREMGQGHWSERIEIRSRDEIGQLAREFNQMCERLQDSYRQLVREQQERLGLERHLRESDRLASVGQLAAGLAHEIGTPLNIIGGRAEYLLRRPRSTEEITENLQIIRSQMDRIANIVRQLLEFSRRREPAFRTVNLPLLLKNVTSLVGHKIAEKGASVKIEADERLPAIQADPDLLQQVFVNLYLNSLHALSDGGRITISCESAREEIGPPPGWVRVVIEDDGEGIEAAHLGHVFDPFFTTKDVGEGTGLGLAVSYGIVKEHGGEIRVESEHGKFTRFIIDLPVFGQVPEHAAA
ncbi:MAG TPA: ATP-binding protein [candidate division Zixibacteria bacterium]|nr:ATP-binding protein [candidate division Zixibacteria bacterium]